MQPLQVVVIGGGAAGFFGAIACAESHPHTEVTLLEASRQPLTKVRIDVMSLMLASIRRGWCKITPEAEKPCAGLLVGFKPAILSSGLQVTELS